MLCRVAGVGGFSIRGRSPVRDWGSPLRLLFWGELACVKKMFAVECAVDYLEPLIPLLGYKCEHYFCFSFSHDCDFWAVVWFLPSCRSAREGQGCPQEVWQADVFDMQDVCVFPISQRFGERELLTPATGLWWSVGLDGKGYRDKHQSLHRDDRDTFIHSLTLSPRY